MAALFAIAAAASANEFDPDRALVVVGPHDGSYAQCVLEKMPGVANDVAAKQLARQCLHTYPAGFATVENDSRYAHGGECIIHKARDTASPYAATAIARACVHRYGPAQ